MRLPWISWDKTLKRLGFVRRKVRRPRADFRQPQVEQLETRDLLTTVDVSVLNSAGEPSGTGKFRISRDGSTMMPLTVYFHYSGTAAWSSQMYQSGDYWTSDISSSAISRMIGMGQSYLDVEFNVINDSAQEGNEMVVLTLDTGSGYTIGSGSATANITDDDITTLTIAATDNQASEAGSGTGTFTISASPAPTTNLTVNFTRSGTATYTTDYSDSPTSITIPANSSSTTVTVTPSDDSVYESGGETVIYTLNTGSNYALGATTSATINISENDSAPGISISDWSGGESGSASFTVTLSSASSQSVTVNYATQDGSATTAGSDYTANSGTLRVKVEDEAGETFTQSMTVTITPVNDPPRILNPNVTTREDTPVLISLPGDAGPYENDPLEFVIQLLPGHGLLRRGGPGGALIAVGDVLDSNQVYYEPNPLPNNFNGNDSFNYKVQEVGTDPLAVSAFLTIKILAVDDAPVITGPVGASVVQLDSNGHFDFSSSLLFVTDIDIHEGTPDTNGRIRVKLATVHGTISVSPTASDMVGIEFLSEPRVGVTQMTILGRLEAVNGLLAKLTFDADPTYAGGDASLVVNANDLGNTGLDGPKSDHLVIKFARDPVNDPPVNHLPAGPVFVRPCDHDFPIPMSVSDVDVGDDNVHVDVGVYGAGKIKLFGHTSNYFWLEGSLDYVNQILAQLAYKPPANAALPQTDQVYIYTTDRASRLPRCSGALPDRP